MSIRLGFALVAALTIAAGAAGATPSQAIKAKPVSFGLVYSGSGSVVKTYHLKATVPCAPMRNVPANYVISYDCTVRVNVRGSVKVSGNW